MADIIIFGYHGFSNSGDEALLFAILDTLRKKRPDVDVTVLSKVPEETARVYGVKSIYRYNVFKVIKEMKASKLMLFGGGSLLQDVTSSKSILYYLFMLSLAKKCKMKTMLYANGIGPISKKINRSVAKRVLNKVDVITLRDDKSDEELKSIGVNKPEVIITADPAFTIDVDKSLSGKYFTHMAGVPLGRELFVVSIRDWKALSSDFSSEMAKLCDYMVQKYNMYPLFVPMQYPDDLKISKEVINSMSENSYVISRELSVPEMFSVLSEGNIVLGMRLHSLIYATTLEIPAMALVYDPKISAFMDSLSQTDWIRVEEFSFEKAKKQIDDIVQNCKEKKDKLRLTNEKLKKMAEENALYAINLLDK